MVKTIITCGTVNAVLINIKVNPPKVANVRVYKLATSGQNFMDIHLAKVKILQKVKRGGFFFDSPSLCVCTCDYLLCLP